MKITQYMIEELEHARDIANDEIKMHREGRYSGTKAEIDAGIAEWEATLKQIEEALADPTVDTIARLDLVLEELHNFRDRDADNLRSQWPLNAIIPHIAGEPPIRHRQRELKYLADRKKAYAEYRKNWRGLPARS